MRKISFFVILLLTVIFPSPVFSQVKVPILIYHSIDSYTGHGEKELYVTPENFEKQLLYLKKQGYTPLTFENWQELKRVKKPIFITFDDGYKNNLTILPIFQRAASPQFHPAATIFVISDFIGRPNRLSPADLKKFVDSGFFSIQSHTATHPDLTKTKNLSYELADSKRKIEAITSQPVIALAYPYGKVDSRVVEETKKNYTFGLSTIPKFFTESGQKNENYLIPRLYVTYSTTIEDFAKLLKEG
ncbi:MULTISPECIES: polysaccharide deacetylase family protein [Priestia]|uniref:polysaccharide deacetylase family protein n=1 Tax=Priestia TaxID=2800373 RepID=UPI000BF5E402|nr:MULTISPECIES: polysaccharide deacetylase family protein [Priestia]PFW73075.1 polysaccharide deacetylase [Priestia aryabhattai]